MKKTYADECLEHVNKAQIIAVQKHFNLETGCDAWMELQELDEKIRDKIAPELAKRLKIATQFIRVLSRNTEAPTDIRISSEKIAEELEKLS